MRRAKDKGFSDVLYLDANNKRDIEEVSSSNVFMLKVFITKSSHVNVQQICQYDMDLTLLGLILQID